MDIAEMNFRLALLLWLLNYASAEDGNCDYYQNITVGLTYYVVSPNYPMNYTPGVMCRWIATCPPGYNCRLDCSEISIPQSAGCTTDRFLVSQTGDPQLAGASPYCGRGSLSVVSQGQTICMGLITSSYSPGGRFSCTLRAQAVTPAPQCRCGERKQMRIVGGQETGINEFKMMAGLVERSIAQIKCGAVIISDRHVLTAAHCVNTMSTSDLGVVVGEHDVTTGDSPYTKGYRVDNITIHPQFNSNTYANDIAIVRTATTIIFNTGVGPACLPFKFVANNLAGRTVTMLGWGTLFPGGPTSDVLRKVDVKVVSESTCRAQISSVTSRQMCTFAQGKDACQDDSGGPLMYIDPESGMLFNVGIISYGRFCASDEPGINTRVTSYLDWISINAPYKYCVK